MTPIQLHNPTRLWVPLITLGCVLVMFLPLAALGTADAGLHGKAWIGVAAFGLLVVWLLRSAAVAPIRLTIDGDGLALRRTIGGRVYSAGDVRDWQFTRPDGPPTRDAPATNALLNVRFYDGARFRGEVTREEAAQLRSWFAQRGLG